MPRTKKSSKVKQDRARLAIQKRWGRNIQPENVSMSLDISSGSSRVVTDNPNSLTPNIEQISSIPGPSGVSIQPNDQSKVPDDLYTNIRKKDFIDSDIQGVQDLDAAPEYLFVDKTALNSLLTGLLCPDCFRPTLKLTITNKVGFNVQLSVECTDCVSGNIVSISSSKPNQSKTEYDINKRVAKAFGTISKGYAAIEQFALVMNMDIMSKAYYSKCMKAVNKSTKMAGIASLSKARLRVREYCLKEDSTLEENSVIDLAVSFDGSWHKRGFTSNYGVGCIIHIDTGLVIDYCVLSKFCRNCALAEHDLGVSSPEFHIWYEGHAIDCDRNYEGSSPGMEVAAAEILWKRSLSYKFRYTTIVSDGDAKVFTHLKNLKIYGEDVLQKEECINHVSKRLGTALRNQVTVCKAQKITLGGKLHGSLKDSTIKKLTRYYHNAVFSGINKDVPTVRNSILATLHHCTSSDENPRHTKCPTDINSWCFYNRAIANNEIPGSHDNNIKTPLNPTVLKHIFPIYKRLTETSLLERCLKGQTQNANESLHSFIWRKCDKARSVSRQIVEAAVAEGVSEYNFGNTSVINILEKNKISPGKKSVKIARVRDQRRKLNINKAKLERVKRRRKYLKIKNLQEEEKRKELEGTLYGAGEF